MKKIFFLSVLFFIGLSANAQDFYKLQQDAHKLYQNGKYEKAIKLCESIIQSKNEDIETLKAKASANGICHAIYIEQSFKDRDIYKSYQFFVSQLDTYEKIKLKYPEMKRIYGDMIPLISEGIQQMSKDYPGCDILVAKAKNANQAINKPTSTTVDDSSLTGENSLSNNKNNLNELVNEFNLDDINSYTSISIGKHFFKPYKFVNGVKVFPTMYMSKISHNGKLAIARGDWRLAYDESQKLYFIDLTDGKILYEFKFQGISNYFFSNDDSKLYFYENKYIKQLDLKSFEMSSLFKIEEEPRDMKYLDFIDGMFHFSTFKNTEVLNTARLVLHYSFNESTKKLELETFSEPDSKIKGNIENEFYYFNGTTEEKLFKLRLIHGNSIQIKLLNKESKDEYIIFNCPQIIVIKNGVVLTNTNLSINKFDKISKEIKEIYNFNPPVGYLTEDNKVVIRCEEAKSDRTLYVLELNSTNENNIIKTKFIDPFEIHLDRGDYIVFSEINNNTGKLYYQYNIDQGCNHGNSSEVNVLDLKNNIKFNNKIRATTQFEKLLEINNLKLSNYLGSYINISTLKNQPLESDSEKYLRVKSLYENKLPSFISLQDSLTQNLNKFILDSIRVFNFQSSDVFKVSNYDLDKEYWRLILRNPFDGSDFSIIYKQSKSEAKVDLANNFSNIKLSVKYYFNPLSYLYEPILLTITNTQSNISNKFIISFKDQSLLKNLYLTNNSYIDYFQNNNYIECRLERGDITYDSKILKYFINNGKPKYYFNYGFNDYNRIVNVKGVSVFNLDDTNFRFNLLDKFTRFIHLENSKFYIGENVNEYLRFDFIPYFINKTYEKDSKPFTAVYDLNKIEPISYQNDLIFPNSIDFQDSIIKNINTPEDFKNKDLSFSPNGKYCAVKIDKITYLYETSNWKNIYKFNDTSGHMYWDCNSYFLGIGQDILPIQLIENILAE